MANGLGVGQIDNYQVQVADPGVPLAVITHTGPAEHPYRITLEVVVPDPGRDVVLIGYALTGVGARVYTTAGDPASLQDALRQSAAG